MIQTQQVFVYIDAIKQRPSFRNRISKVSENKTDKILEYLNNYL